MQVSGENCRRRQTYYLSYTIIVVSAFERSDTKKFLKRTRPNRNTEHFS